MPKPYSNDLRQKVLNFYKESRHKSKTCSIFNIGRMTLDRWIELERVQGHVNRPHPEKAGRPYKIKDLIAFKQFVEHTQFSQAKELVSLFEKQFGYTVAYSNILFALKKLGWSHKKRVFFTDKHAK
jgi:transposase